MHPLLRYYALHAVFATVTASVALLIAGVWATVVVGAPVWPSLFGQTTDGAWSHSNELSFMVLIITATGTFSALYAFAIARIVRAIQRSRVTDVQGGGWQLLVPSVLAFFVGTVLCFVVQPVFGLVAAASLWPMVAGWRVARPFKTSKDSSLKRARFFT
jgi:hypothetical protein